MTRISGHVTESTIPIIPAMIIIADEFIDRVGLRCRLSLIVASRLK